MLQQCQIRLCNQIYLIKSCRTIYFQYDHTKKIAGCYNYITLVLAIANIGKHQKICYNLQQHVECRLWKYFFVFCVRFFKNCSERESYLYLYQFYCLQSYKQVMASFNQPLGYDLNLALVIAKRGQFCNKFGHTIYRILLIANSNSTKPVITQYFFCVVAELFVSQLLRKLNRLFLNVLLCYKDVFRTLTNIYDGIYQGK